MLNQIIYTFPIDVHAGKSVFRLLTELLSELPNAQMHDKGNLTITPSKPAGALPVTIFAQSVVPFPQLHLNCEQADSLSVGNLRINPDIAVDYDLDERGFDRILAKHDSVGEYLELHSSSDTMYRLPMDEIVERLTGHIVRIDHTGINLPSALLSRDAWERFMHHVARQANLYRYPTTDAWPFVLPATQEEHEADIIKFPVGREPRFELVYDDHSPVPTIQLDIETDLTRPQVEHLFPQPYGISFPDLADFFRTVYIHHEWPGLAIRLDIRFNSDNPGDWETGKWLVKDGGRIRPPVDPRRLCR